MSVVPNAVFANPTTSCWEPAGENLNPTFDTVTFNVPPGPFLSERIGMGQNVFGGDYQVGVFNANANTLGPLQVGGLVEVQGGSSLPSQTEERMLYQGDGITYQEANTGTNRVIVKKTMGGPPTTFALTNIDSINGNKVFSPAYGSFSSTTTQTPLATTVTPVTYDTEDIVPAGMSAGAFPSASITVTEGGVYKVVSSLQCNNTAGGTQEMDMWVAVGGIAVPNSATRIAINQNQEVVMTVEWFLVLAPADSFNVELYVPVAGPEALAVPAAPPVPAIPSIITTVLRIA